MSKKCKKLQENARKWWFLSTFFATKTSAFAFSFAKAPKNVKATADRLRHEEKLATEKLTVCYCLLIIAERKIWPRIDTNLSHGYLIPKAQGHKLTQICFCQILMVGQAPPYQTWNAPSIRRTRRLKLVLPDPMRTKLAF